MKALITGASSGIGRDMARYLDKLGIDLVLVARRKEKLESLAKELNVNTKIISLDLGKESNVYKLYEKCKEENIDILINNAGFGLFGDFAETDLAVELNMIDVNIKAPHILTKLFLKDFIKKDSGYILNVCSSAGFMAGPKLNTYYATKNYLTKLTMAINEELRQRKSKVVISALCPGPTSTEFNKVAKGTFGIKEVSSEYVAKYGIDKMFQEKMIILPTLSMKLGNFGLRFIPYRLQLIIAYHIQWKKSRQKNN
ncbi:MAG: SDR family oxidoreductase [Firmicutes bacterium]|nr:SDR family oxidoreductase [Bacillota bacterium]